MAHSIQRLDRLTAILLQLQTNRFVSAKRLSERFQVCVRTVYRDIRSLEAAGFPIGADPGKGFYLVEGFHLPPISLDAEEAGALLIALKLAEQSIDDKTLLRLQTAREKIQAVLSSDVRSYLSRIDARITVCARARPPVTAAEPMQSIQHALSQNLLLEIQYGESYAPRVIEPLYLGFFEEHWHLLAFCRLRNAYRDFRVDRIRSIRPREEHISRTHPSILEILQEKAAQKELHRMRVRIKRGSGYSKIKSLCLPGSILETDLDDGFVELTLHTDSIPVIKSWLGRYCSEFEILEPLA